MLATGSMSFQQRDIVQIITLPGGNVIKEKKDVDRLPEGAELEVTFQPSASEFPPNLSN